MNASFQDCCDIIVSNGCDIVPTLQRCVAQKIVVANRVTAPLEKLLRDTLVFYIVYHAAKSESILVSMKQNS